MPGVTDAGAVCTPPLEGECGDYFYSIPGQTSPNDADANDANFNIVDNGYFRTASIRLLTGRSFLPTDTASSPHVTVVNETFARKWWPAGDAIGHTVLFGGRGENGNLLQIVGIVHDTKQFSLDSAVQPELFFPETQSPAQAMVLLARTAVDPMSLASSAEQAIQTIDKQVPVRLHPMSYFVERTLQQRRFITLLLTIFAGLAMLLAALGIFGVAAYAVTSRRAEIAVRLALGAEPGRVKTWISAQILRRVAAGCAIGIAGSLLSRQIVSRFLYGVSAEDPAVLTGACVALLAVAAIAVWLPARRAAKIDPMQTLRAE